MSGIYWHHRPQRLNWSHHRSSHYQASNDLSLDLKFYGQPHCTEYIDLLCCNIHSRMSDRHDTTSSKNWSMFLSDRLSDKCYLISEGILLQ